ncbi:sugar kinase [Amycolatopsis sp. WAC 04197]|uniref:ROK family transcriptional regulator n=1 Tax=Amycolatopsis sp. WAC 04197 TaxID=2203199 RepID=UPI000F76A2AA|nr:ROK family transcriptional regulator [Amycolatopsis sp. WAC 04197]RSN39689.1 sugar kinase [Amycolatopsis sp. WAC 04197]
MRGDTARMLRRHNQSLILTALYHDGPLSRVELSAVTGLGAAAVSQLVAILLRSRLIREAGQVRSRGGRPRILLEIDPGAGYLAGVDVAEGCVAWGLFDLAMRPIDAQRRQLRSELPDIGKVAGEITSGLRELLNAADVREPDLLGVGIGLPKTAAGGPATEWSSDRWRASTGLAAPVFAGRGVHNLALAESKFGAARGADRVVVIELGAGADAALVVDGRVERICEWGHTTIDYGGRRCHCGVRGCIEAYVGARGVLRRYHELCQRRPLQGGNEVTELTALLASAPRSETAAALVRETAGHLGAAIGNLISLFTPTKVVLAGWAGLLLGGRYLAEIGRAAAGYTRPLSYQRVSLELGRAGPRAELIGAAALPLAAVLDRGEDPRTGGG